jgi:hypothetical protein
MVVNGEQTFTTHKVEITVDKLEEPIYLIPFGDVHRFADLCAVDKWKSFCEWAKKKKRCYFLGMGDYDDIASTSERKGLSQAALHDTTLSRLDGVYNDFVEKFIKEISFMKGRLIGLIEGNHFGMLQTGMSTTQLMCEKMGCKFLGKSSFIRLSFGYGNKKYALDIYAHHGRGGGRTAGSSVNSVEAMRKIGDADIYLMAHDHQKFVYDSSRMRLSEGGGGLTITNRKILLGRTGSFLKGYEPGKASYVSAGAYPPTDIGVIKIEMTPRRIHRKIHDGRENSNFIRDCFYVDIHASA